MLRLGCEQPMGSVATANVAVDVEHDSCSSWPNLTFLKPLGPVQGAFKPIFFL